MSLLELFDSLRSSSVMTFVKNAHRLIVNKARTGRLYLEVAGDVVDVNLVVEGDLGVSDMYDLGDMLLYRVCIKKVRY